MQIQDLYSIFLQYPSIQTDTRKLKVGDLFFALKGPNFNGNLFALQALQQGAAYAIIDEDVDASNPNLIKCDDVLATLQALAKYHRQQFSIPFIAITGSNGKTTSKELISTVLASHFITYTTQGNLNNHIGVPLTILSVKKDAQIAVIEMGANHQKEIESYCQYALPTHGIITNIGKAHLEGFGGINGVKKGKGELFTFLKNNNGVAFAYAEYVYFTEMTAKLNHVIWFGSKEGVVQGYVKNANPFLQVALSKGFEFDVINTNLVGDYNVSNVLAAITIGKYFGVPDEKIKAAIENYEPSNSRSQMIEINDNHIVLDAYNANPSSMKAAIENFAKLPNNPKILMLGAMMELGEESVQEHQQLIHLIEQFSWQKVLLVGGDFKNIHHPYEFVNNSAEATIWFAQQKFTNSYILIKGSRSMQMEKVLG